MYVRFIEITSPSTVQFDMAVAWFKTEWSGLAAKGGAFNSDFKIFSDLVIDGLFNKKIWFLFKATKH